jgi:hypothetical protein
VSPVKYELLCYIPEDGILHSHRRVNFKTYLTVLVSICDYLQISYVPINHLPHYYRIMSCYDANNSSLVLNTIRRLQLPLHSNIPKRLL